MKSHLGLFGGLLIAPLFLTACGTQSQLSFEEAKNALQEQSLFTTHQVLFDTTTPLQEDLSLTTTIQDEEQSNVVVHLTSQSQEDKLNHKGQSQLGFDVQINAPENILGINGNLSVFATPEHFYFNLEKLDLNSSVEQNAFSIEDIKLLLQGIQGQWLKLPLSGGTMLLEGNQQFLQQLTAISKQIGEVMIKQGQQPYQGTFSQFAEKPAYQFTLDTQKIQTFVQTVITTINTLNQQSSSLFEEGVVPTLPAIQVDIPVFEGNLVLLENGKVAMVVDTFELHINDVAVEGEYRYGPEGMVIHIRDKESGEEVFQFQLQNNKRTSTLSVQLSDLISLTGTLTTSTKKSAFTVEFDLVLQIDTLQVDTNETTLTGGASSESLMPETLSIPFQGEWSYQPLDSILLTEPTQAVNIMELLGAVMGMGIDPSLEMDANFEAGEAAYATDEAYAEPLPQATNA